MGVAAKKQSEELSPGREKILGAAEQEFSASGFEAASMKAISTRADVSQALLHYHFGSKERLYAEVIRARSKKINDSRRALLDQVDFESDDALSQVLEALFRPALAPEGGGKAYARIFAGMIVGRAHDRELVRECYDPTAHVFLDAIQRACPGMGIEGAGAVYQFALGVLVSALSRDGRMERLMGHQGALLGDQILIRKIVTFVVGGAAALTEDRERL
ncbi:MAG: TetR/AcrR family transcriptional regulator [Pseudomonadota bacterium]